MRLIKTVIIIFLLSWSWTLTTLADEQSGDISDISAYYGFGEIETIKLNYSIRNLKIADFNGDGRNDILIVDNQKSNIEIFIQKENIGPEDAQVTVDSNDIDINVINPDSRFSKESVAVSQNIYSLVCGDLNSDGLTDLAYYGSPKGLYIILQKPTQSGETLSWQQRKKIKLEKGQLNSNALICADLNNDGRSDLAVAGLNAIYMIFQQENGQLAEPIEYPVTATILGMKTADLNGDGIKDLVLITDDVEKPIYVRFGLSDGRLGPQIQFFIEKPYVLEVYNVDDSPDDEILAVDAKSGRLLCYKLAPEKQENADWPIAFYPLKSADEDKKRDLVVGDFDGDGLKDIVISEPGSAELIFYKQNKNIGLAEPVRFPAFADIDNLSAADINGDGKTELAILSVKEKVIGISKYQDQRLSFPEPIELTDAPVAMQLADVDHNGKIDCVYISKDSNDIRSFRVIYDLNNSNKKLKETSLELKKLESNPDGIRVLDVDQDGLEDVLVFDKYNPPPMLIHQVKKGIFELVQSTSAKSSLTKDATINSIAVADIDGKQGKELLIAQKNFARSLIFSKDNNWTVLDQYNAKSTENTISAVAAFELPINIDANSTNNLRAILLLDGQKGQIQILKAGSNKTYRLEKEIDVGKFNAANHLKLLYEPLTGTDAKSILLFDSEKFALITPSTSSDVPLDMQKQFSYDTKIKDGVYGNMIAGDINCDGRVDLVMVEYKQNHIEILAINPENKPTAAMRFKIFEQKSYRDSNKDKSSVEPRELKIADVTGDGKKDLITVIHDRIIIYPQD